MEVLIQFKTVMIFVHLLGLVIGLGAATAADCLVLRAVSRNGMDQSQYSQISILTNMVVAGLFLLVVSGFGFIYIYDSTNPILASNPKIWAKATIVLILSINGYYLHEKILPLFKKSTGLPMMKNKDIQKSKNKILIAGAVSGVSWWVATLLGVWKELNFHASYLTILAGYLAILVPAVVGSICMGHRFFNKVALSGYRGEQNETPNLICKLTGLYNGRYVEEFIATEIHRANRYNLELSVLMIDIDRFSQFNDRYNETVGNHLLIELSQYVHSVFRDCDLVGRFGSDKFIAVLPHTSKDTAQRVASRLRCEISKKSFDISNLIGEQTSHLQLSVSIGVASLQEGLQSKEDLLIMSQIRSLECKNLGGNMVDSQTCFSPNKGLTLVAG